MSGGTLFTAGTIFNPTTALQPQASTDHSHILKLGREWPGDKAIGHTRESSAGIRLAKLTNIVLERCVRGSTMALPADQSDDIEEAQLETGQRSVNSNSYYCCHASNYVRTSF